jgi:hypothetical protein
MTKLTSIGLPNGWTPETEADHYMVRPGCGALIDMRDLGTVLEHAGELPHGKGIRG